MCKFLAYSAIFDIIEHVSISSFPFMSYVVGSKVKELIKKHGCNTSGDLTEALSAWVDQVLTKACKRAEGNGRKTVRPVDL